MSLDNRISDLEDKRGAPEPRPLLAMIAPDKAPDPPDHFPSEEAMEAWCSEQGVERPVVVILPPKPDQSLPTT